MEIFHTTTIVFVAIMRMMRVVRCRHVDDTNTHTNEVGMPKYLIHIHQTEADEAGDDGTYHVLAIDRRRAIRYAVELWCRHTINNVNKRGGVMNEDQFIIDSTNLVLDGYDAFRNRHTMYGNDRYAMTFTDDDNCLRVTVVRTEDIVSGVDITA